MKIHIEVDSDLLEDEVIIRCGRVDETVNRIHQFIIDQIQSAPKIIFFKQNQEFYFPLEDVLFFETEGEHIYAHTTSDAYRIKHRLYELEKMLPKDFARASKSTIINIRRVYSITRSLTASSPVTFVGSHKQVYVSRFYFNELRHRLNPGAG